MDGARGQDEVATASGCSLVMIKHAMAERACISGGALGGG